MARTATSRARRRTPREWAVRGGAAAAALVLGYVSVTQTLGAAVLRANPERAYALAPGDGRIAGALAERLAASEGDPAQYARADTLAREALAREPLAVPALTALGLDAERRGERAAARRFFVHSDRVSRRELGTRLWLIEDAVAREDVAGALRHYDIALRTEKSAPDLLFPVLAGAIGDRAIAGALAATLARRPAWGDAFVYHLAMDPADPVLSASFLSSLAARGYPVPEAARASVVDALASKGAFEAAWRHYASLREGVDRRRSRNPDFAATPEHPSVFDWTAVMTEAGVSASLDGGLFDFAAPPTVGGIVLRQAQMLPPGRYRLTGVSEGIEQPAGSLPYWQVVCADGRELGRVDVPASAEGQGRFAGTFAVPGGCPVQTLRLVTRPSTEVGGVSGRIRRAAIVPAGEAR